MVAMITPIYILEEERLRRNLALIRDVARRTDAEWILAFKAFALWKVFPIFREYIHHTTASSPYEARLAYEEFGSKAHTYSPAYEQTTFDEIMRCSSHVTFNSLSQYNRFIDDITNYNSYISCGLRVNPEYSEIETELYNPCSRGSRFGVLASQLSHLLPKRVEGFHIHCHCENNSDVFERTLFHFEEKFCTWFPQLKWINFGGGHLVTHKDYDIDRLVRVIERFKSKHPDIKLIMEPGSAFAWQTGTLISKVVDIVENGGIKTAILNVSFTCHMPDCLEMPYHPKVRNAEIVTDLTTNTDLTYRLGGNSCLSGDFMGSWRFDHKLEIGETIVFEDMMHYTTVKTNMFNGIHHPSIGMLKSDGKFQILKSFHYEDYKCRMC